MSRNPSSELIAFGCQLCDLFLRERGVKSSVMQRDVSRDTSWSYVNYPKHLEFLGEKLLKKCKASFLYCELGNCQGFLVKQE